FDGCYDGGNDAIEFVDIHGMVKRLLDLVEAPVQHLLGCVPVDARMSLLQGAAENSEIFTQFLRRHRVWCARGRTSGGRFRLGTRRLRVPGMESSRRRAGGESRDKEDWQTRSPAEIETAHWFSPKVPGHGLAHGRVRGQSGACRRSSGYVRSFARSMAMFDPLVYPKYH